MPERSADEIKREIEKSRVQLASSIDQLVTRTSPKTLANKAKQSVVEKLQTPPGQAAAAVAGGLVVFLVIRRIRRKK